ncbi:MAG: hypothetical protein ACRCUE_12795, partial [Bosea sp. (in: a-proteobacteria)]
MRDTELSRVRGVPGVAWAVPLVQATATLRTNEGRSTGAAFLGVDDASLAGINSAFVVGSPENLRGPDAIAIDQLGFARLWPGEPIKAGKVIEVNERRAVVVAITNASPGFAAPVVVYTRLTQALAYTPGGRNRLSFVLASHASGLDPAVVARDITAQTGLKAMTSDAFRRATRGRPDPCQVANLGGGWGKRGKGITHRRRWRSQQASRAGSAAVCTARQRRTTGDTPGRACGKGEGNTSL